MPAIESAGFSGVPVMTSPTMAFPGGGGIKITLINAKIYAEKVIIKKSD